MNYYDLNISEFLDVITDKQNEYTYYLTDDKGVQNKIIEGTIEEFKNFINRPGLEPEVRKKMRALIEGKPEYNYEMELSEIEIYNYLEKITSNFDREKLNNVYWIVNGYYQTFIYERVNNESYNIYLKNNWEIPYYKSTFQGKTTKEIDFNLMRSKTHLYLYMGMEYCMNLLKRKKSENRELNILTIATKKQKKFKEPLTFSGLFKPEYREIITILIERLKLKGFTDKQNNWIINNNINEPAKLYYYLKEKKVMKDIKFTPSIKCFYNEFGCEVVEKKNVNPRASTRTNLLIQCDTVMEKTYDSFLLSLITQK